MKKLSVDYTRIPVVFLWSNLKSRCRYQPITLNPRARNSFYLLQIIYQLNQSCIRSYPQVQKLLNEFPMSQQIFYAAFKVSTPTHHIQRTSFPINYYFRLESHFTPWFSRIFKQLHINYVSITNSKLCTTFRWWHSLIYDRKN